MDRQEVLEQLDFGVKAKVIDGDFRVIPADDNGFAIKPSPRGQSVLLDDAGTRELFRATGLNLNLQTRAEHDALATVMTQALQSQGGVALMVNDEGQATGLLPGGNAGTPVNPERALRKIEAGLRGTDIAYQRVLRTGMHARIEVVGERTHPLHGKGHKIDRANPIAVIGAGVAVTMSPVGDVVPSVQAYTLNQICENGLVISETLVEYKFTGGGDENVYNWLKGGTRMAEQAVGPMMETFRALASDEIPEGERAGTLEALIQKAKLPNDVADAVRNQAIEQTPKTGWEMMQLITFATTHLMQDIHQIVRAEKVVRTFAKEEGHARSCPTCHSRRN